MEILETSVRLSTMHFYAYHGVMPQEQTVGAHFDVSLTLKLASPEKAVLTDELSQTVNYAEAYNLVGQVMQMPSQLLEHVAARILQTVFQAFPYVSEGEVEVVKVNPPMGAAMEGAGVRLHARNRLCRQFSALVLDFDGTLADTATGIIATMQATFDELDYQLPSDEAIRQTIGLPLRESIALLSGEKEERKIDHATATYRRLFKVHGVQGVKLFSGVKATLQQLTDRGLCVGIATSRSHGSVVEFCQKLEIAPYISAYIADEDICEKKPAPEAALKLMQLLGSTPEETLVVGDTTFDIAMGRAAGCATCGVTYGNHKRFQLFAAGADALLDGFEGLTQVVNV